MARVDPRLRTVVERYFETELDARLLLQLLPVRLRGGQWLFHQGDPGDSLYLVARGRLQAWMGDEGTRQEDGLRLLGEMAAGDSVGEVGLISGEPRAAGVRAIRDSLLVRVDQENFARLAEAHPSLGLKLAANVAAMLQKNLAGGSDSRAFRTVALLPLGDAPEAVALCHELSHRLVTTVQARALAPRLLDALGAPLDAAVTDDELPAELREWLSDQEYDHPMVVFSCACQDSAWTRFALRQADLVVLVAEAGGDPHPGAAERALLEGPVAPAGARALVLMHGVGEAITATRRWLAGRRLDFHLHFRAGAPGGMALPATQVAGAQPGSGLEPLPATGVYGPGDLNRIVRVIAGKATGLVLSSGAARGLAQLGVFRALREAGINVDWVGGTSVGAVVAAAIAMDWSPQEAAARVRTAVVQDRPFADLTIPVVSLLAGERFRQSLTAQFDRDIEDLPLPYFCISSNLGRGVVNVHQRGRLVDALRASAALPGVLPPQVVDNELAVDGGVLDPLPVGVMQARPVHTIIAVDVSALSPEPVAYDETPSGWQVLRSRWLPWGRRHKVPGLAAVMLKAAEIGAQLHSRDHAGGADLVLRPPLAGFEPTDLHAFDRLVEAGYRDAVVRIAAWLDGRVDAAPENAITE